MASNGQVKWAVAARPKPGETQSGDMNLVLPFDGGVLIAAIDALGHGAEAADAATVASHALRVGPMDSVISLMKHCHSALRGKRGVVMSIAKFHERHGILSWLGVGNVEGILVKPPTGPGMPKSRLVTRGGVVGSNLPELRAEEIDVSAGGMLLFATDGLDLAFGDAVDSDPRQPQDLADDLLRKHAKASDDALVLVARFPARAQ
jgi:negative regulator of sigma-B (phosphoserine phosphatase)